jgi:hypothetical protein
LSSTHRTHYLLVRLVELLRAATATATLKFANANSSATVLTGHALANISGLLRNEPAEARVHDELLSVNQDVPQLTAREVVLHNQQHATHISLAIRSGLSLHLTSVLSLNLFHYFQEQLPLRRTL